MNYPCDVLHPPPFDPRRLDPREVYEQQFGHPADIDAVWAARDTYQNQQKD